MNRKRIAMTAALLLSMALGGVTMAADVVGFNKCVVPPSSDAVVTVPFVRASVATLTATGKSGTGITVAGPLLGTDAYATVFYVRMTSGAALGRWSTISGNSTTELTLADTNFLANVAANDTLEIVPHQTLASVFEESLLNISFTPSTSSTTHTMEVKLPDMSTTAINKAPTETYYFRTVSGVSAWRKAGAAPSGVYDATVLLPQSYFIIRNLNASSLNFITRGIAASSKQQARDVRTETVRNDVPAASGNAMPVALYELHLGGTAAFLNSTSATTHIDELLVFTNSTGMNNPPPVTYYYRTFSGVSGWRKAGDAPGNVHDADVLPAGASLIIRKGAGAAGTAQWTQ